ncbi:hypothetical protein [Carnobacterium funditum]|uniref:hypothetical protein n=1 Tax=Carnobacterium funditum TaxID=2752 RepID=UPI0005579756|nr:hypothetical protein [Carnobacterium funditum]
MLNLFSNPVFIPLLLSSIGIILWWILSSTTVSEKKSVLNLLVDRVVYFLLVAFIVNALFNFPEILALPYRSLILSTKALSLSLLIIIAYSYWHYLKESLADNKMIVSVFQLVSLLGLVNQVYYYFLYKSPLIVGLILLFSGLLLFSSIVTLKGNGWVYASMLGLVLHLMVTRNQAVLYFGFVITPELVALILAEWGIFLVILLRRQRQSERT